MPQIKKPPTVMIERYLRNVFFIIDACILGDGWMDGFRLALICDTCCHLLMDL